MKFNQFCIKSYFKTFKNQNFPRYYIIIDQKVSQVKMYYNFTFSYQYPLLPLNVSYLMLGVQSQLNYGETTNTNKDSLEDNILLIKKQEQKPQIYVVGQPQNFNVVKKTNKLIKKQEIKKPIINLTSRRKRQADSFTERRNILPNNINHILAFIQRKSKSEVLVKKILQKQKKHQIFTSKRFYCYQTYLKQKLHIHVNKDTLYTITNHLQLNQDIFSVQQQLCYNRICRILISYYLRQLAKLKILSSTRVKNTNKLDHLKAHRTLLNYLVANFDQE